jgi:hypothetical protein
MKQQIPGLGHNRPDVEVDDLDLPAIKIGLKRLPPDFSLRQTLRSAESRYLSHAATKRASYRELRYGLQESLQAFLYIAGTPGELAKFVEQCKKKGITIRKGTPLESAVIRCSDSRVSDEKVNRWANAIREAIHRHVRPDCFARYLAKRGQGVNALNAAFKVRKQDTPVPPEDKLNDRTSLDSSEVSEESSDTGKSAVKKPKVAITCAKKRIPKLLALEIGDAIRGCEIKRTSKKDFVVTKF